MTRARFQSRGVLAIFASSLAAEFSTSSPTSEAFRTVGSTAVVDIRGPLMQHAGGPWDSYEEIRGRVDAALASASSRSIVLRINSPGGDMAGCVELAGAIRARAKAAGKRVVAYVDGMAASAAYALACAADAIYTPPSAVLGSVGCLKVATDTSAADRAMGIAFAVVTSGARKADGIPFLPITTAARAAMQREVDELAAVLFGHVAASRKTSPEKIKALDAATFVGASAVKAGLADGVLTFDGLLAMLASGVAAPSKPSARPPARPAASAAKATTSGAAERARLMASRPDFDPSVAAFLNTQPIAVVRHAVETFEGGSPAKAHGTKAKKQEATAMATKTKEDAIEALMNLASDQDADPAERKQAEECLKLLKQKGGDEGAKASAALVRVEQRRTLAQKSGILARGGTLTPAMAREEIARRRGGLT